MVPLKFFCILLIVKRALLSSSLSVNTSNKIGLEVKLEVKNLSYTCSNSCLSAAAKYSKPRSSA